MKERMQKAIDFLRENGFVKRFGGMQKDITFSHYIASYMYENLESDYALESFKREALRMGKDEDEKRFLQWIYDRLKYNYREDENTDFMCKFREIINKK